MKKWDPPDSFHDLLLKMKEKDGEPVEYQNASITIQLATIHLLSHISDQLDEIYGEL